MGTMQSPLKRPDIDDSPRDPSMLKVAPGKNSFDSEEGFSDLDIDPQRSADEYMDEYGYADPTNQDYEEPQEEDQKEQGMQKAPVAPEPPSNDVPPPEESASNIKSNTTTPTASNNNNNNNNGTPGSKKPKKPKPEMNPDWKEVKETGAWGQVSTRDIVIAVVVSVVALVGVVVGVVLGLRKDDDDSSVGGTKAPTMAPTMIPPETELIYALNAIDHSDYTYLYQQDLPQTVEEYEGLMDDTSATPQARAMSWLLYDDTRDISNEAGERWALASLFYYWKGSNWNSAKNWLSSESACEWEHISCDALTGQIQEITLDSNNLVGTIPPEIALLNTTQSLWLKNNSLTGPLPNEVFGSMPRLSILYLDKNQLTGTISVAIRNSGSLNSLFLQYNDLTGEWPRLFCPFSSSEPAAIANFGIDCDEVTCPQQGCCTDYNCYYDT